MYRDGDSLNNSQYTIQGRPLGSGSFGITFKAVKNNLLQLPVAIKMPDPNRYSDRNYSKFITILNREITILSKICTDPHPNIVKIIDYFEEGEDKLPCLVMEFIPGQDLSKVIEGTNTKATPLLESQAVNYIRQIGDALAYLHEQSIIHGDVHPGNIMLSRGRHPILIDFGLAKEIQPFGSSTAKQGHPNFVAYEQRTQGTKKPTVDIYSLAATLYYAVTGEYPTTSWDRKNNNGKLIPPKEHCNISNNLNQAILAGMALEAQDRPQTMQEWLNLLNSGTNTQETDDLSSQKGIDYRILRDLLVAGNWKDADTETRNVIYQAVGREKDEWIRDEELSKFPPVDLRTIDNLWVKYSDGKFGFSVQKRIYLDCGGITDGKYYQKAWDEFSDRVGWRIMGLYVDVIQDEVTLSTSSEGHLPWLGGRRPRLLLSHPDL